MVSGGHNRKNFKHTEKTKKLIGIKGKGRMPWNKNTKGIMKRNSGSFKKGNKPIAGFNKKLIAEGKLTVNQIAFRCGVDKSTIYNWKGYNNPHKDNAKRPHKKQCESCHEKDAVAILEGKDLCRKCFDLKKKGEAFVNRKEKEDPEVYDPSDLDIDDDVLED